jgi:hypothetical protein
LTEVVVKLGYMLERPVDPALLARAAQ